MTNWQNRIKRLEYLPANQLLANPLNARRHPAKQRDALRGSLDSLGWYDAVIYNERTGYLVDGHARVEEQLTKDDSATIPVLVVDLSEEEEAQALASHDWIAHLAEYDKQVLDDLLRTFNSDDERVQTMLSEMADEFNLFELQEIEEAPEAKIDEAEALREKWQTERGQLWVIPSKHGGEHRLLCGDSTNASDVQRLIGGDQSTLIHADPPYGMGKEKDGVLNDNLYRSKLDAFQMAWWGTMRPYLKNNSSAYVWGNAPDLWRWWYVGGLNDSERLTLKNEIVWNKTAGILGAKSDTHRCYTTNSERCLFFMLGDQVMSENADNYWDGWEPIRKYLYEQRMLMGWDVPTMKTIVGHSTKSPDHWTNKSQWEFPTRKVYEAFQKAANDEAFKREYEDIKREYEDIKREYMDLRAYFDNTHEVMTDVWTHERVVGDERYHHATPKPVELIQRIIKSSSRNGDIVIEPFGGSGSTMVACEQLHRQCRMIEIEPKYVATILERMSNMGLTPVLME